MTSTVNPPVIDTTSPGTPAGEWANQTTSALNTEQSPSTTPGHDLPGAFPSSNENGGISAQGVGETLADTARTYLPQSVINTMDAYLGTHVNSTVKSSSNDVSHQPTLPTQELLRGEKAGGVGSLPGTNLESGVAKLPDERSAEAGEKTHTAPGYVATAKEALGQVPLAVADAAGGFAAAASGFVHSKGQKESSLPSQEVMGAGPRENVSGVEALPGLSTETGVAKLPDESRTVPGSGITDQAREAVSQIKPVAFDIRPVNTSSPAKETSGQVPGKKSDTIGALPGGKNEAGVTDFPDQKWTLDHDKEQDLSSSTKGTNSDSTGVPNPGSYDVDKSRTGQSASQPAVQLEPRIHPLGGDGAAWNGVDLSSKGVDHWEQNAASSEVLPPEPDSTHVNNSATKQPNGKQKFPSDEKDHNSAELQRSANQKYPHTSEDDKTSASSDARPESTRSSAGSGASPKKVGFKEKLSGGRKVLIGKLGHNPEKVEEGRKILHGEA